MVMMTTGIKRRALKRIMTLTCKILPGEGEGFHVLRISSLSNSLALFRMERSITFAIQGKSKDPENRLCYKAETREHIENKEQQVSSEYCKLHKGDARTK
jgi:hypothetical protein